jgi:[ribosomal protein S5]-alanine N-acetyltransferase
MIINTKRFQLKILTTKDVTDEYLSWFSKSKDVEKYISFAQKEISMDDLIQYVKNKEDRKDVLFLAIFTTFGQHIGNIKYESISPETGSAVMGILIGDKEWRGKGVASEVVKGSSEYLRKNYKIKKIKLSVRKNNISAVTAYKKMQFKVVNEDDDKFKMLLRLE